MTDYRLRRYGVAITKTERMKREREIVNALNRRVEECQSMVWVRAEHAITKKHFDHYTVSPRIADYMKYKAEIMFWADRGKTGWHDFVASMPLDLFMNSEKAAGDP